MARTDAVWDPERREFIEVEGAKLGVAFSAAYGDFVEVDTRRRLTAVQQYRRDNQIEDHIADTYATLRETAAMYGCHNSTIYRRQARRMGRRHDEVALVWVANKAVSLDRANAARKLNRQLAKGGSNGETVVG